MKCSSWRTLAAALLAATLLSLEATLAMADSATYTYDQMGRLVKLTYDNGTSITYNYDAAGNRTSVVTAGPAGIFHGVVAYDGRPSGPTLQVPLTLVFFQPGTSTMVMSYAVTADSSGAFATANVPPGVYDVSVASPSAISRLASSLTVAAGDNPVHNFGVLGPGDINSDGVIDLLDFSLFRLSFGTCVGQAGYNARADLNGDGCVDLIDFSLLRKHFGEVGPQPG